MGRAHLGSAKSEADADLVEQIRKNAATDVDYSLAWTLLKLAWDVDRWIGGAAEMPLDAVAWRCGEAAARIVAGATLH